jgi:hypothetical protein
MAVSAVRGYEDLTGRTFGTIKLGNVTRRSPELYHSFECLQCRVEGTVPRRVIQYGQFTCPNRSCGVGPRRPTAADIQAQADRQRGLEREARHNYNTEPKQPQGITTAELDRRMARDDTEYELEMMTPDEMRKAIRRIELSANKPPIEIPAFDLFIQPSHSGIPRDRERSNSLQASLLRWTEVWPSTQVPFESQVCWHSWRRASLY